MTDTFVNLHCYSHFSILQSLISPKDLIAKAKELGQSAVGLTDCGTLAGVWDAHKAAKEADVKLIVGCELYFANSVKDKSEKLRFIVLIAKNHTGYKNLLQISKLGFENHTIITKKVFPVIDWEILAKYSDGIICLTGCGNGVVGQLLNNKKFEEAEETLVKLKTIFGTNLGAEIQAHNLVRGPTHYTDAVNQVFTNQHIIRLADKYDIRIVPTTGARYLKKEQAETHDALLAIGSMQPVYSNARMKFNISDLYLKTAAEIKTFFSRNYSEEFADKICANSIYFSDLCEKSDWVDPMFGLKTNKELPVFPVKDEPDYNEFRIWSGKQSKEIQALDEDKQFLRFKCELSFAKLNIATDKIKIYRDRLEEELDVLYYCGVSSYMLITADFLNWARKNGIGIGPGRGSVGGSFVGYLLGIHSADPIKYKLVFARFYNKLKTACADVDNDVAKGKRHLVIEYLIKKYGKNNFAQISNYIYITPKVYARDLARSFEFGGSRLEAVKVGTNIADIIPKMSDEGKEIRTYQDIVKKSALFSEWTKKYPQLEKCSSICGKPRALGLHAAGVVITERPVSSIVPTRVDKDSLMSVQFDKDRAEETGLVKIDILGLETLDIIEKTNELIRAAGKEVPVIDYEKYDEKTYKLIGNGQTNCVFQFGTSAGTIDLCKKIQPKSIEDLAIITTLARPASKEIREDFIKARLGKIKPRFLHPSLMGALKDTFGFPLYDESLLILANDVAGWSYQDADKLRKLTKEKGKNPEKAEKWRVEFIEGAVKNKVPENTAKEIWHTIIEPFGKYSFNCSHAVLYSMVSFHTSFLKAHFPIEFLLANLIFEIKSASPMAKQNIDKIKQEIRATGVKILSPDINKSGMTYQLLPDGNLLTGFEALKNVGDDAIQDILNLRPFKSFDDFMIRTSGSKIRSNTIQSLVATGCLDSFGISRKLMYLYCSDYKKKIVGYLKKHNPETEPFSYAWPIEKEWSLPELYALEENIMNEAFICSAKVAFGSFFNGPSVSFQEIKGLGDKDKVGSVKGIIKSIFSLRIKKTGSKYIGMEMLKITLQDEHGDQIGLTIFPKQLAELKTRMKELKGKFIEGIAINFAGTVNVYSDELGLILDSVYSFSNPPQLPKDLKSAKIKKSAEPTDIKKTDTATTNDLLNTDNLFQDIEDDLINEGLLDLDEENDD